MQQINYVINYSVNYFGVPLRRALIFFVVCFGLGALAVAGVARLEIERASTADECFLEAVRDIAVGADLRVAVV